MAHIKFQEYLDRQKKLKASGTVKTIADYDGTVDSKPAKEKKHKDAGGKGQVGTPASYHGSGTAVDPNKGKNKDGFAGKGDKKLEYNPDVKVPAKVGEGGSKKATWPKTKTQEWIDSTKGLSLAEFTKTIREKTLKGLDECACQEPHSSIKETVDVCKANKTYVSALVREMKRNKMFGRLFGEMMQHPESWGFLAKLMEVDEGYARKLVKAMNEMIAPPMGAGDGMGPGGPPMMKPKKKKPMGPPMGGDTGGDMGGGMDDMGMGLDAPEGEDDMGMDHPDDMGDDSMGDEDMDDPNMGDDEDPGMGDDPMGDDMGLGDDPGMGDDMGMGPDGVGDPSMGDDPMGMGGDPMGGDMPAPPHDKIGKMPMKKKKKHGMDHLLGAMKDHPAMHGSLRRAMMNI